MKLNIPNKWVQEIEELDPNLLRVRFVVLQIEYGYTSEDLAKTFHAHIDKEWNVLKAPWEVELRYGDAYWAPVS